MPDYRARFLIGGRETTPSQHQEEEKRITSEPEFDEVTPREALEFIREASQALGVRPQPKRYRGRA